MDSFHFEIAILARGISNTLATIGILMEWGLL
jgi:hypothetical protein